MASAFHVSDPLSSSSSTTMLKMASSWSEYKNEFIDPSVMAADHSSSIKGPLFVDQSKRDASDKFWLAQFEEEKERLHQMNDPWRNQEQQQKQSRRLPAVTTPFDQYEHRFLDPITPKDYGQVVSNTVDPETRAKADEFWLQTFLEDKAKLHNKREETP
jgi:hypothetical protein